MLFTISRETLLQSLQLIIGATEKKQALAILGNALLKVDQDGLTLIATDLQVEVCTHTKLEGDIKEGVVTVSARKLLEITRAFPENSDINLSLNGEILLVKSGQGVFRLNTLSGDDFPNVEEGVNFCEFSILSETFRTLIDKVYFSVAEQDVRFYLNGLYLEKTGTCLRSVATDGHRLSTAYIEDDFSEGDAKAIIPRRCALELMRFLNQTEGSVSVTIGESHLRVFGADHTFTSRLIEGGFPDYRKVIPKNVSKQITIDRDTFKSLLARAAILSNEKYHGLTISLTPGSLMVEASNADQEVAKDELSVLYDGEDIEGAYNAVYLLDATNALPAGDIKLSFSDGNGSAVLERAESNAVVYIVMPMRL